MELTWARSGVRLENGHLVWFEQTDAVATASGAAVMQTTSEFLVEGPPVTGAPDEILAELRRVLG